MPTALVTGASRGLGAAIARALAPTHDVLLGGRPSGELDALATELDGASTFPVELTDHDEMEAATEAITGLDVLVHNAGVGSIGPVEDTYPDEYRAMMEVNFIAVAELTRQLLPALREAGGHVIVINSGAGRDAKPGWSAYAASKFAVRAFADALRHEEPLLRVTTIYPGRIDTDMQRDIVAMEGEEYDASRFLRVESVAAAVVAAVTTPADAHPTEVVLKPTGRA
ncbi:SDR family oxidoreductase [Williamsia deligens]|uniref:SDR family oxidoreductase n=1 Tax=Williamsia deligens TaxID=321325 RepID=A0ABW3G9C5_9NOCA|nr:SDR family oxidoreductase [Williamsia deligens]MCP2193753.1 NADP-dependent 3-hydroxy acid dehydrogenase YdfG [Williamsia deligens]